MGERIENINELKANKTNELFWEEDKKIIFSTHEFLIKR